MTRNYTTITAYSNKFNIWLVNKQGDVFIQMPHPDTNTLQIKDLTICAIDKSTLLKEVSLKWDINILQNQIKKVYAFKAKVDGRYMQIVGYTASIHLNLKTQNLLCKKYNGIFVNYRDLESKIKQFERDEVFIESYCELLRELDNQFGWFNHYNKIYKR